MSDNDGEDEVMVTIWQKESMRMEMRMKYHDGACVHTGPCVCMRPLGGIWCLSGYDYGEQHGRSFDYVWM